MKAKDEFQTLVEKKQAVRDQIDKFYDPQSLAVIAPDLSERDVCVVDSAMISSNRQGLGRIESNFLFLSKPAASNILGYDYERLVSIDEKQVY